MRQLEEVMGQHMYSFEVKQFLKGLRPPLPNTPLIGGANLTSEYMENLVKLKEIYGGVDSNLINLLLPNRRDDRQYRRYLLHIERMKSEDFSSV